MEMQIILTAPYSSNEKDSYLRRVLAYLGTSDEYVVWIENMECIGYAEGHYCSCFDEAYQCLCELLRQHGVERKEIVYYA